MSSEGLHSNHGKNAGWGMAIAALGVVFGDIGTSPLYAFKECFHPMHGITPTPENVYGVLSLIFWSLMLVVVFKYLSFILRADNRSEGGIMALLALLTAKRKDGTPSQTRPILILMGLFGAALLYGDGVITPAISVLSAIEGLEVATPAFKPMVVPITMAIIVVIFWLQRRGTAQVGSIFGPVTLVWFVAIAAIGAPWIFRHPDVLLGLNPLQGISFFARNGLQGFLVLSAVVLCITGAEALYADMGHFGKRPIRLGWYAIVYPALTINYFGQGAVVLQRGEAAVANPFYALVDGWMLYPLVAIATSAACIASQALISGAYSLTQQAVQLGYLPRITILHTSRSTEGQIYVPRVNQALMLGCLALVVVFGKSTDLAAAYGIAVTGTMIATTVLFYAVVRQIWGWSLTTSIAVAGLFLVVDLAFFSANIVKIAHGGWVPLVIAAGIYTIMTTWKRGRELLSRSMMDISMPLDQFFEVIRLAKPPRVKGTAVFMTLTRNIAPSVLQHHFRHNQVLHERILLLSIITKNEPEVDSLERVRVTELEHGFFKVIAMYGYMETPDISEILGRCECSGLTVDYSALSFYLGRETYLTTGSSGMWSWRKRLFVFMSKNARTATEFFRIPPDRVIEIGSQIRI
jgi:KUP system potassium uptake protein